MAPQTSKTSCWNPDCSQTNVGKICSRCASARYCSRECQAAHWKAHKKECLQLQTKKVQKDEKKAYKKADEMAAHHQSNMADSMAQMMADSFGRMATNIQDPAKRNRMEKFSRDMAAAVQEEKQKKAAGQYDASWIHDKEARKKQVDEMAKLDKEMEEMLASRGMKSPSMELAEEAIRRYEQEERGEVPPMEGDFQTILSYTNPFGMESPKPESMDEIVARIEPVLPAIGGQLDSLARGGASNLDEQYSKLGKLSSDVAEHKALTPSVKATFSPDNLASIENKWKRQVSEFMMLTMNSAMEGMMRSGR